MAFRVLKNSFWGMSLALAVIGLSACQEEAMQPEANNAETVKSDITIITNGTVLTMNAAYDVIDEGTLVIKGNEIVAIGGATLAGEYKGAVIIDAKGGIIMPGMINLHNHLSMVAFRGLAETGMESVEDRLYKYFFPLEKNLLDRNLIRVSARQAAIEMALGGVTTTTDMYYHEDEVAKSVKEVGLRGVLGETIIGFPVVDAPTPFGGLAYAEQFIKDWQGDALITPAIAPHAPYTMSPEELLKAKALADKYGAPLIMHMAEFASEAENTAKAYPDTTQNRSVIAYLNDIGFLGDNVLAAHVIYLDDKDMDILKAKGVGVSHNPKANTKDMSGLSPAWTMYKKGIDIGLGTDGPMSSNQMDIINVMPYAVRVARVRGNDVSRFNPRDAVEMATIGGARALDMEARIGSLEIGKRADIIIVDTTAPNMQPNYDPYASLVFSAYPSNVALTMVDGKVVARDGEVLTINKKDHQEQWGKVMDTVGEFAQTLR